jgi:hypothetical protein
MLNYLRVNIEGILTLKKSKLLVILSKIVLREELEVL